MTFKKIKKYLHTRILIKCILLFSITNIKGVLATQKNRKIYRKINIKLNYLSFFIIATQDYRNGVKWENIRCSVDTEQVTSGGKVRDISRFPWFGVVQHTFCKSFYLK